MRASFRFYAELNDFLPESRRAREFEVEFPAAAGVKDLIEAAGVPHTEVDLILANGRSVDFAYRVTDGDRISVYPVFESFDIASVGRLRPEPLREPRFVVDVHLGQLARYLRLLGFDTLYRNDYADDELAAISSRERRILLTRDRGLLKRSEVTHGYCVRGTEPRRQLADVVARFDLAGSIHPFLRCMACNGELRPVAKDAVAERLPPRVRADHDDFRICARCDQLYWRGSHYDALLRVVEEVAHGR